MQKKQLITLMGFVSLLALCGCRDKVLAPAPERTPPPAMPPVPVSHIRVRLALPLAVVSDKLNHLTADKIVDLDQEKVKCGVGACRLSLLATRTGPLVLQGPLALRGEADKADYLHLILPFDARATLRLPGFLRSVKAKVHTDGVMQISSRLWLEPDGRLGAKSDGSVQLQGGNLRIGPVQSDLAHLWNANADKVSGPLFKTMDRQIATHVDTRRALSRLWRQSFQPIPLHTHPQMWLELTPQAVQTGAISTTDAHISMPLGLDVKARLVVQKNAPDMHPTPLPALQPFHGAANRYQISLPVVLPYDRAETLALKALQAHPPHISGMRLHVLSLHILPSGRDIVVQTDFCAAPGWDFLHLFSACGTVYFRGVPEYDAARQEVRIRNLTYDLQSRNALLTRASKLAGPEMARALEKYCHFDFSEEIDRLRRHVTRAFSAGAGTRVHIDGTVTHFAPESLKWTDAGFVALMQASGTTDVDIRAAH